MKNNLLSLILVLCLIVLLFGTAPHASAEEIKTNIFYLEETSHMIITVEYTAEVPEVYFLAPDGTEYGDTAIAEGRMRKETADHALVYRIPNASYGQWQIVYDKGSNEKLSISWAPYAEPITVTTFTFQQQDDTLEAQLFARYARNERYEYQIYAALVDEQGNVTGTKELKNGTAVANQTETIKVGIGDLPTYQDYRLMVQVVMKDGSMEVEDSAVAENAFSYTNADMPEPLKGVYLEIGVDDETLLVDWSKYAVSCSGYTVAIFADDKAIYTYTFEKDVTATKIPLDPAYGKIKVQIAYTTGYSNKVSQIFSREVELSGRNAVAIEAEEATSQSNVKILYDFTDLQGDVKTVVKVNDKTQEAMLSGNGSMTAALEVFENELYVQWYLDEDTVFTAHKSIYYDNIAPLLVLPELTSGVKTSAETYVLVGYTDPGCEVTVNGQVAALDEMGGFSVTLNLQPGKNTFTITAKNTLGNSSVQTFTVERAAVGVVEAETEGTSVWSKILGYLPMILTFAMSILLLLFALLVPKAFVKRKENKGLLSALVWLAGSILLFLDVIAAGFAGWSSYRYITDCKKLNSMEFFDAANTSVSEAYKLLQQNAGYLKNMICWLCVFGGLLLVGIGLLVLSRFLNQNRPAKQPVYPVPQQETEAELPPAEQEEPVAETEETDENAPETE